MENVACFSYIYVQMRTPFLKIILFGLCLALTEVGSFAQQLHADFSAFAQNKGQIIDQNNQLNEEVLFFYSGNGLKIQLRKSGYSYELFSVNGEPKNSNDKFKSANDLLNTKIITNRVDVDFIGMNSNVEIVAEQKSNAVANYFISGKKIADVHFFNKVTYKNVFPKIDIEFLINEKQTSVFKYNIILHPGADIQKVKLLVKGASVVKTTNGDIEFFTNGGKIIETIPFSFYEEHPQKNVAVDFVLKNNYISFSTNYDKTKTFVIDPSTNRIWGTYYGGGTLDYCTATDVDAQNNVYITGYTLSTTNIATSGTYQSTLAGSFDAYLAKFNSNGVRIWATYFGGSSVEAAYGMCIASNGNIYLCGDTFSTSGVATASAHQTTYGGGVDDALLVKFDSTGQLLWSTYYGGLYHDIASAVVEDGNGNVIMAGHSESATAIATAGSYNNVYAGGYDVFIVKFDSAGVRQWGTYYGEIDVDECYAIACDVANNIYITGFTTSINNIATPSGHQITYSGLQDAFIAKFNAGGTTLLYGTYYGGPGNDAGTSIKVNSSGDIFFVGNTTSFTGIATTGCYQSAIGSADDAFITRFNASGVRQWGTYFGGDDVDYIADLSFDSNENILFCGSTMSSNTISSVGAYQSNLATINLYDSYFEKFDTSGTRKLGTYFGGSSNDHARGISIDNLGKVYIAGETSSVDSIASVGSFNTVWAGGDDAFLAKFCVAPEPQIYPSGSTTICYGDTLWLSAQAGFASYFWSDSTSLNPLITSDSAVAATYYYTVTVNDGNGCSATSDSVSVIVDMCFSILENENELIMNIFPVPASDFMDINFSNFSHNENAALEVYSSSGELIMKESIQNNNFRLNIKKLSPGIYILQVRVDGKISERKFLKQ